MEPRVDKETVGGRRVLACTAVVHVSLMCVMDGTLLFEQVCGQFAVIHLVFSRGLSNTALICRGRRMAVQKRSSRYFRRYYGTFVVTIFSFVLFSNT